MGVSLKALDGAVQLYRSTDHDNDGICTVEVCTVLLTDPPLLAQAIVEIVGPMIDPYCDRPLDEQARYIRDRLVHAFGDFR